MTALLFLHPIGLDGAAADWLDIPPRLAPDLPGHGANAATPITDLDDMADFIADRLEEPVDVIGALLGGALGMHLTLRHPRLVRSLVLAGTDARLDRQRLLARAAAVLDGGFGPDDILPSWFGEDLADPTAAPRVAYARERLRAMSRENYAAAWRALADHDVTDRLGELRLPVTVIAASADTVHPGAGQAALAERLPSARAVEIEAHHMSLLDAPAAFSAAVRDHLRWADEATG